MEKNKKLENYLPQESESVEIAEDKVLSQMAEQEEGEFNQPEEAVDDITHDLRSSRTRRG